MNSVLIGFSNTPISETGIINFGAHAGGKEVPNKFVTIVDEVSGAEYCLQPQDLKEMPAGEYLVEPLSMCECRPDITGRRQISVKVKLLRKRA